MGTVLLGLIFLAVISILPIVIPLAIAVIITLLGLVLIYNKYTK